MIACNDRVNQLGLMTRPILWLGNREKSEHPIGQVGLIKVDLMCSDGVSWNDPTDEIVENFKSIYIEERFLDPYPLNFLSKVKKLADPDCHLYINLKSEVTNHDPGSGLKYESLVRISGFCGWECVSLPPKVNDLEHILILKLSGKKKKEVTYELIVNRKISSFDDLFLKCFGHSMHNALWDWKYGAGKGISVVGVSNQRIISHYGGIYRVVNFMGQPIHGIQVCDVMVDRSARKSLEKNGLFSNASKAFLDSTLGYGSLIKIAFGFPSLRAYSIGERLGIYSKVEEIIQFKWHIKNYTPSFRTKLREIYSIEGCSDDVALLWHKMALDLENKIIGVRDVKYLVDRYENHPQFKYRFFIIRNRISCTPLALFVLRKEEKILNLMDFVGPLKHLPTVIRYGRRLARDWACDYLLAWITSCNASLFRCEDAVEESAEIVIPTDAYVNRLPYASVRNKWWLMMGDTDFL